MHEAAKWPGISHRVGGDQRRNEKAANSRLRWIQWPRDSNMNISDALLQQVQVFFVCFGVVGFQVKMFNF